MLNLLPKRNVWLFNAHGINSLATTAVRILCKSKGLSIPGSGNYVVPTLWKKRSIQILYCSRMLQYGRHRQRWEFSHRFCNTRNGRFERRFKEDNFDCVKSDWTWCIVSTKARFGYIGWMDVWRGLESFLGICRDLSASNVVGGFVDQLMHSITTNRKEEGGRYRRNCGSNIDRDTRLVLVNLSYCL